MKRKIILEENKPPQLEGEWAVGEILSAAKFLAQWVESQKMTTAEDANDGV